MHPQTQLSFLRSLQKKAPYASRTSKGFTLVEVLVVAGILAILFASLVPNLLRARARAAASAVTAEAIGMARGCQAVIASGTGLDTFKNPADQEDVECNGVAPAADGYDFVSREFTGEVTEDDNIRCVDNQVIVNDGTAPGQVTITAEADGTLTCSGSVKAAAAPAS
jgi:type IV pilus assembly protein PilA